MKKLNKKEYIREVKNRIEEIRKDNNIPYYKRRAAIDKIKEEVIRDFMLKKIDEETFKEVYSLFEKKRNGGGTRLPWQKVDKIGKDGIYKVINGEIFYLPLVDENGREIRLFYRGKKNGKES